MKNTKIMKNEKPYMNSKKALELYEILRESHSRLKDINCLAFNSECNSDYVFTCMLGVLHEAFYAAEAYCMERYEK